MKPFNLERALAGDPVVTRDGRPVKIAGYNEEALTGQEVIGWLDGVAYIWGKDGTLCGTTDLFMAPTERKEWIVRGENGNVVLGPYKVKADAESCYLVDQGATIHEITIIE
jgi:hypothetical protein